MGKHEDDADRRTEELKSEYERFERNLMPFDDTPPVRLALWFGRIGLRLAEYGKKLRQSAK